MTDIVDSKLDGDVQVADRPGDGTGAGDVAWTPVCRLDQLVPGRGAAARAQGAQIALFRVPVDDDRHELFALGNRDPFSGAHVLSRGIVGDTAGIPKVASPVYKQAFDLRTGICLDDPAVSVPTYPVRVCSEGWVSVGVPATG